MARNTDAAATSHGKPAGTQRRGAQADQRRARQTVAEERERDDGRAIGVERGPAVAPRDDGVEGHGGAPRADVERDDEGRYAGTAERD